MGEITLQLNSPLTDEQWDTITDVDFDHTDRITFHTKHGKEVEFVKSKPIKTNADKYFRNATDEELVEAWYYIYYHIVFASTNSRLGLLEWLKQEVEDDG